MLVTAVAQLPPGPLLKRGSTITLICNITINAAAPTQVLIQWLRQPIPAVKNEQSPTLSEALPTTAVKDKPILVAALIHNGVAKIYTNGSEVSVERLSASSYRLRVHAATEEDQGMYACHAEAWGQDLYGGWYNTGARAESNAVSVYLYARGELLISSSDSHSL